MYATNEELSSRCVVLESHTHPSPVNGCGRHELPITSHQSHHHNSSSLITPSAVIDEPNFISNTSACCSRCSAGNVPERMHSLMQDHDRFYAGTADSSTSTTSYKLSNEPHAIANESTVLCSSFGYTSSKHCHDVAAELTDVMSSTSSEPALKSPSSSIVSSLHPVHVVQNLILADHSLNYSSDQCKCNVFDSKDESCLKFSAAPNNSSTINSSITNSRETDDAAAVVDLNNRHLDTGQSSTHLNSEMERTTETLSSLMHCTSSSSSKNCKSTCLETSPASCSEAACTSVINTSPLFSPPIAPASTSLECSPPENQKQDDASKSCIVSSQDAPHSIQRATLCSCGNNSSEKICENSRHFCEKCNVKNLYMNRLYEHLNENEQEKVNDVFSCNKLCVNNSASDNSVSSGNFPSFRISDESLDNTTPSLREIHGSTGYLNLNKTIRCSQSSFSIGSKTSNFCTHLPLQSNNKFALCVQRHINDTVCQTMKKMTPATHSAFLKSPSLALKLDQYATALAKDLVTECILLSSTLAWNIKCSGQCSREQCRQDYYQSLKMGTCQGLDISEGRTSSLSSSSGRRDSSSLMGRSSIAVTLSAGGSPGLCWTPEVTSYTTMDVDNKEENGKLDKKTCVVLQEGKYAANSNNIVIGQVSGFNRNISTNTSPPTAAPDDKDHTLPKVSAEFPEEIESVISTGVRFVKHNSVSCQSLLYNNISNDIHKEVSIIKSLPKSFFHTFPRTSKLNVESSKKSMTRASDHFLEEANDKLLESDVDVHSKSSKTGRSKDAQVKKRKRAKTRKRSSSSRQSKPSRASSEYKHSRLWVKSRSVDTAEVYSQPVDCIKEPDIVQPKAIVATSRRYSHRKYKVTSSTISAGLPILNTSSFNGPPNLKNSFSANAANKDMSYEKSSKIKPLKAKKFGMSKRRAVSSSSTVASPCQSIVSHANGDAQTSAVCSAKLKPHLDGKQSVASDPIRPSQNNFHSSSNTVHSEDAQRSSSKSRVSRKDRHEQSKFCKILPFAALKSCKRKEHSSESRDNVYVASSSPSCDPSKVKCSGGGGRRGHSLLSNIRNSLLSLFTFRSNSSSIDKMVVVSPSEQQQVKQSNNCVRSSVCIDTSNNSPVFSSSTPDTLSCSSTPADVVDPHTQQPVGIQATSADLLNHSNYSAFTTAITAAAPRPNTSSNEPSSSPPDRLNKEISGTEATLDTDALDIVMSTEDRTAPSVLPCRSPPPPPVLPPPRSTALDTAGDPVPPPVPPRAPPQPSQSPLPPLSPRSSTVLPAVRESSSRSSNAQSAPPAETVITPGASLPPCQCSSTANTQNRSDTATSTGRHVDAGCHFATMIEKVKDYGWYWGPISGEAAEKIILNEPDGSFVVRDSSDDHYIFSLTFKLNGFTRHVRIEHDQGNFSFGGCTKFKSNTIVEFIESAVEHSRSGRYLFFLHRRPGLGPMRVQLLHPVSRYRHIQSLQHLCRFVIVKNVRRDLLQKLPLPPRLRGYLSSPHYYCEQVGLCMAKEEEQDIIEESSRGSCAEGCSATTSSEGAATDEQAPISGHTEDSAATTADQSDFSNDQGDNSSDGAAAEVGLGASAAMCETSVATHEEFKLGCNEGLLGNITNAIGSVDGAPTMEEEECHCDWSSSKIEDTVGGGARLCVSSTDYEDSSSLSNISQPQFIVEREGKEHHSDGRSTLCKSFVEPNEDPCLGPQNDFEPIMPSIEILKTGSPVSDNTNISVYLNKTNKDHRSGAPISLASYLQHTTPGACKSSVDGSSGTTGESTKKPIKVVSYQVHNVADSPAIVKLTKVLDSNASGTNVPSSSVTCESNKQRHNDNLNISRASADGSPNNLNSAASVSCQDRNLASTFL